MKSTQNQSLQESPFDHNFDCNDYDDSHNELDCKHEFDIGWSFQYLDKKTKSLKNIDTEMKTMKVVNSYSTSNESKKYNYDQLMVDQIKRPNKNKHRSVKIQQLQKLPSIEELLQEQQQELANIKNLSTKDPSFAFSSGYDTQLTKQITPKFQELEQALKGIEKKI